jgi:hypothetical protein
MRYPVLLIKSKDISLKMKVVCINYANTVEFVTSGFELLWGNCTVLPVPVQGILTGGTKMKVYAPPVSIPGAQIQKNRAFSPK